MRVVLVVWAIHDVPRGCSRDDDLIAQDEISDPDDQRLTENAGLVIYKRIALVHHGRAGLYLCEYISTEGRVVERGLAVNVYRSVSVVFITRSRCG